MPVRPTAGPGAAVASGGSSASAVLALIVLPWALAVMRNVWWNVGGYHGFSMPMAMPLHPLHLFWPGAGSLLLLVGAGASDLVAGPPRRSSSSRPVPPPHRIVPDVDGDAAAGRGVHRVSRRWVTGPGTDRVDDRVRPDEHLDRSGRTTAERTEPPPQRVAQRPRSAHRQRRRARRRGAVGAGHRWEPFGAGSRDLGAALSPSWRSACSSARGSVAAAA